MTAGFVALLAAARIAALVADREFAVLRSGEIALAGPAPVVATAGACAGEAPAPVEVIGAGLIGPAPEPGRLASAEEVVPGPGETAAAWGPAKPGPVAVMAPPPAGGIDDPEPTEGVAGPAAIGNDGVEPTAPDDDVAAPTAWAPGEPTPPEE